MLRACFPCASDGAAFDDAQAYPGDHPCAAADAPTSADDACSGDASSSTHCSEDTNKTINTALINRQNKHQQSTIAKQ